MQSGRRVQPRILQPFSSRCLGASEDSLLAQLSSRVSVVSGAGRASTPAPAAAVAVAAAAAAEATAHEKLRKYAPKEAMSPEAQLQANVLLAAPQPPELLLANGEKPTPTAVAATGIGQCGGGGGGGGGRGGAGPDLSAFDDVTPIKLAPSKVPKVDGRRPLRGISYQVFASVSVSIGSMIVGFSSAYTSPALVSMMLPNSTLLVTTQQASWIGSLMPLSALIGGMTGGLLIEWIGRRATILATAIPFIVSWLLIGMAVTVPMVYAGRVVAGFCVGVTSLCLPVYMGETIQPEVRGMLGLISTTLGNIGILVCFLAGKYLNWSNLAFFGAMIPVPFLLCTLFIPETPRWYISKEKHEEAMKSLKWLRGGQHVDVSQELSEIEKNHRDAIKNAPVSIGELFNKGNLKPIFISISLMFFQQLSGINAVIFYTVNIFQGAGSTIDENLSTIVVGIVNLGSTFLATVLIDRLGRRVLLGISAIAMSISLAVLGTFFYLRDIEVDVSAFGWLPLLSFVVFVIGFSLGFGPIPWLMLGEIFPAKIRGPAASFATAFNWACTFLVTKTFTDLELALGGYGAFWMFGVLCFISLFFVIFCVPETQGRSLEDIEKNFKGKVRRMSSITNIKPTPMAV